MIVEWLLAKLGMISAPPMAGLGHVREAARRHAAVSERAGRCALDIIDRQQADGGTDDLTRSVAAIRSLTARATDRGS